MTYYNNAVNNQKKVNLQQCWDSAVGIVIRYKLNSPRIEFQYGPDFLHLSRLVLGHDVNHPLPSSTEVKERVE